jgi:hypothetical protein
MAIGEIAVAWLALWAGYSPQGFGVAHQCEHDLRVAAMLPRGSMAGQGTTLAQRPYLRAITARELSRLQA